MAAFDRKVYQRDLMRKRRAAEVSPKLLAMMKDTWPRLLPADQESFVGFLRNAGFIAMPTPVRAPKGVVVGETVVPPPKRKLEQGKPRGSWRNLAAPGELLKPDKKSAK